MAWKYQDGPAGPIRIWVDDAAWQSKSYSWPSDQPRWRKQPRWLTWLTLALFSLGAIWAIQGVVIPWNPWEEHHAVCKGAYFVRYPTQEEIRQRWQIISRLNNCTVMPELRPTRPSPEDTTRFYTKTLEPIWQKALARRDQYYLEDYFADLQKQLELCQANLMPLKHPFCVEAWGSGESDAQQLANHNGYRDHKNEDDLKLSREQMNREMKYDDWYAKATAIADPKINWLALGLWLLFTYLKGALLCLVLYAVRLWVDGLKLRHEIGLAPLRFAKVLAGWPLYVWLYPHDTTAATELKRLRLVAEYLRDKPSSYRLSREEEERLATLAKQPSFQLGQLLALIQSEQDLAKRKALVTVGLLMFFGMICSSVARAQSVEVRPPPITVCSIANLGETLHQTRDGPNSLLVQCLAVIPILLTLLPVVVVAIVPRTVTTTKEVPGEIDHIPKTLMA